MMHDGARTVTADRTSRGGCTMRREDDADRTRRGEDRDRGWTERREGPSTKLIVLAVVAVLLVVFVLQNTDRANIDFLLWQGSFPLWTMILVAAVLGTVGGWILGRIGGAERRARDAERRLRERED
jgi:uncharacterized integral membrane protein